MRITNLLSDCTLQNSSTSLLLSVNKYGQIEREINKEQEIKKQEMEASIRHSRTIQGSIMSGEHNLYKCFPESFLIDKPKDIVSGDFFWLKAVDNKIVVVVADCTGHGIPAALMSVLGISLLNQIVVEEKIVDPALILKRLSNSIKKTFHNSDAESGQNEGMDIAVACIDFDSQTIVFEGALRPVYIISDQQLTIIKGSRNAITGNNPHLYTNKTYNFKKGDILYLFTDGFADQFGGNKNKKLLVKRFQNILLEICTSSMGRQMVTLEQVFHEWKSDMEQTDDILMAGIKL